MKRLVATYRLQLGPALRFADVAAQADYLERLGVSHVYLSPISQAVSGSPHGYDVADPRRISEDLGGEEGLRGLAADLAARGIGIVLDTVPNHMACSSGNPYWEDLLMHGVHSRFAAWFDIDWSGGAPLRLPRLAASLERAVEAGEIALVPADGAIRMRYFDESFPLDPRSLPALLAAAGLHDLAGAAAPLARLPGPLDGSGGILDARAEWAEADLEALGARLREREERLSAALRSLGSREILGIARLQAYRLVSWRAANRRGSYRRFFDINELIASRLDDPSAMAAVLDIPARLASTGLVDGVRVDHVDGLRDPAAYLSALRRTIGDEPRIWVEKVLGPGESPRADWPVSGTTGYDFIALCEPLFVDPEGARVIEEYFRRGSGEAREFEDVATSAKKRVLLSLFGADLRRLLERIGETGLPLRDAVEALTESLTALPVYRTYVAPWGEPSREDRETIASAFREAVRRRRDLAEAIGRLEEILLSPRGREALLLFQQISGPVMAKGVEDTAFYRYFPLASLCEVGASPALAPGDPLSRFHEGAVTRADTWPEAMNAASTHDTKRSADARARISALSEAPGEWISFVERRRERHAPFREAEVGFREEYALYQALFAIWEGAATESLTGRLTIFCEKALRESKDRSSWLAPNERREGDMRRFVQEILGRSEESGLRADLDGLIGIVERTASAATLSRVALQLLAPGVPDIYMGDETTMLTLVDPDNRGPVDWSALRALLSRLPESVADCPASLRKTWLVARLLRLRRERPSLFESGTYEPLCAEGKAGEHIVAFRRSDGSGSLVAAVTRLALVAERRGLSIPDCAIRLPRAGELRSYLDDLPVALSGESLELREHLTALPVAVFVSRGGPTGIAYTRPARID